MPIIESEATECIDRVMRFRGSTGITSATAFAHEVVLYTAVSCLPGREARAAFDTSLGCLYLDLEGGMAPINFVFPWLPLPKNRTRDRAPKRLATIYMSIIQNRRAEVHCHREQAEDDQDIIWHLMRTKYKDGSPVSDKQIAHILIAMVMGASTRPPQQPAGFCYALRRSLT